MKKKKLKKKGNNEIERAKENKYFKKGGVFFERN
jgi:hypothetical protein